MQSNSVFRPRYPLVALVWGFWLALAWPLTSLADADAQDWMQRMLEARKLRNYEGVLVYGRGEEVNSVQVVHRYQNGEEQERLLHLDGERREIRRQGDKIICILPGKETLELEHSLPSGPFSGPYAASPILPAEQYRLTLTGGGRVAGYDAVKLAVMAQDDYRYSYLLWLDKQTALPLKSLVLNKQGEVLERMQYTTLTIDSPIDDPKLALPAPVKEQPISGVTEAKAEPAALVQWRPQWLPPGFQEVPALVTRVDGQGTRGTDSLVYSDGMSAFSVFIEPVGRKPAPEGVSQTGATIAYARSTEWADSYYMITVVGEVPKATAQRVAESVRAKQP